MIKGAMLIPTKSSRRASASCPRAADHHALLDGCRAEMAYQAEAGGYNAGFVYAVVDSRRTVSSR